MAISSEHVKLLREKTGAGMMDCKKALEETSGDFDKAIEFLRKKGAATAQKRAEKAAKEGVIVARVNEKNNNGLIVEINCETDFVAKSNDFVKFSEAVANTIQEKQPESVDQLIDMQTPTNESIKALLNDLMAKVGEKIEIRRFNILNIENGSISAYTHMGNKIGVLVELSSGENVSQIGRDIAMQVAAMNPQYVSRDQVPNNVIQSELEIYRTQAKNEGKPEQVIERIANGKLEKYFQEVCLTEQIFIKDSGKTIRDILNEANNINLSRFVRYHLGEENK